MSYLYHTDVLIPEKITIDGAFIENTDFSSLEVWKWNIFYYVSLRQLPPGHPYYGEFIGHPISEEEKYHNPFSPRKIYNAPLEKLSGISKHEFK